MDQPVSPLERIRLRFKEVKQAIQTPCVKYQSVSDRAAAEDAEISRRSLEIAKALCRKWDQQ